MVNRTPEIRNVQTNTRCAAPMAISIGRKPSNLAMRAAMSPSTSVAPNAITIGMVVIQSTALSHSGRGRSME